MTSFTLSPTASVHTVQYLHSNHESTVREGEEGGGRKAQTNRTKEQWRSQLTCQTNCPPGFLNLKPFKVEEVVIHSGINPVRYADLNETCSRKYSINISFKMWKTLTTKCRFLLQTQLRQTSKVNTLKTERKAQVCCNKSNIMLYSLNFPV